MTVTTIPTAGIADTAVSTAKIADNAVTVSKADFNNVNFKNLIINGDMSIAQRGASFSFNDSSGFTVDRFHFERTSGATGDCTITQESDAPNNTGLVKSVKIAVDTAETPTGGGNICFQQKIEGFNCATLEHGQSSPPSATLTFWVKSNKTGTYSVQIKGEGSTGRYVLFDYTISSANTWEKKTITWVGDTSVALDYDSSRRLRVIWHLASGPDDKVSPTSSWATSSLFQVSTNQVNFFDNTSNEIYITGVQLEVGTSASDFEFLPVDVNERRCFRYFQDYASFKLWTTALDGNTSTRLGGSMAYNTRMRATPSVSKTNNTGTVDSETITDRGYSVFGEKSNRGTTTNVTDLEFDAEL